MDNIDTVTVMDKILGAYRNYDLTIKAVNITCGSPTIAHNPTLWQPPHFLTSPSSRPSLCCAGHMSLRTWWFAGLVNKVNTYIDRVCPAAGIQPDALRVRQTAEYITRILRILGLSDAGPDDLGFTTRSTGAATEQTAAACAVAGVFAAFASTLQALPHLSGVPGDARARMDEALSGAPQQQSGSGDGAPGVLEEFVKGKSADAVVDELVACRDVVRAAARDAGAVKGDIMRICDEVRDISLVEIGIKLEDKPAGGVWMRVDAAELRKEVCTFTQLECNSCCVGTLY